MRENLMRMYKNKTAPGKLPGAVLLPVQIYTQERNTLNSILNNIDFSFQGYSEFIRHSCYNRFT